MSVRPSGHTAVMAGRQAPEADTLDFFPTPPWSARAGGELVKRLDPGARTCWEPACGEGHMAWGLGDYFDDVYLTDIHDYGFWEQGFGRVLNFLDEEADLHAGQFDWIITNPPFKDGEAFVRAALPRARRGVAMLLRSVFLEGAGRRPLFTDPALGFAVAAQFAERVPMVKGRWDPQASSATAYSWFIWIKRPLDAGGMRYAIAEANAAGGFLGLIIPPGTKSRLSRPADLARFCRTEPIEGELA
jgi:hypothetical protein